MAMLIRSPIKEKMKTVSAILLVIFHAILSSCSCAIYHREYKVSPKVLDDDFKLAKLASKKAGYKEADTYGRAGF